MGSLEGDVEVVVASGATFVMGAVVNVVGAAPGGAGRFTLVLSELGCLGVVCDGSTAGVRCARVVVGGPAAAALCPELAFGRGPSCPK
jgi:hypothetical protein